MIDVKGDDAGTSYGTVSFAVDGEERVTSLTFPMYALRDRSTLFGVSEARYGVGGQLDLDDLVVKNTEP